ncbi:MAG: FecR domain-containing protein [Steroidobacteraceae bacterium]
MNKVMQEREADQTRIDAEAADWLVRHGDSALTQEERAAFDAWAASDPRRSRTFAAMSRTWRDAADLKHLAHLADAGPSGRASQAFRAITSRLSVPRSIAFAAVAVAVLAVVGSLLSALLGSHETGVGQTRVLSLADGSTVVLGAKSRVVVRFTDRERLVRLTAGEALFEVRHNPARPFVVDAGDAVIWDVGTRFDVNRAGASVRVAVLEGEVEVRERSAPTAHVIKVVQFLRAGDGLEAVEGQAEVNLVRLGSFTVRPVEPVAVTAWRDGRLVYENARLADVVADVNRYYAPGVTLDSTSADLRVTASFRTNEIPAFLNTLDSALPVKIQRGDGGHFDVSRR